MRGNVKHKKVVSSGRLTGGGRVQPIRRRLTGGQTSKTLLCTDPTYSLYSTDSEDQVAAIHKGLDGCAALLSGILQAEREVVKSSVYRPVSSSVKRRDADGKKTCDKPPKKTVPPPVQKRILSWQSVPVSSKSVPVSSKSIPVSSESGPGLTASSQSAPTAGPGSARTASLWWEKTELQSATSEPAPEVPFNRRLTSSTPTPSPEEPPAPSTTTMDSPAGRRPDPMAGAPTPGQRPAPMAGAPTPGQPAQIPAPMARAPTPGQPAQRPSPMAGAPTPGQPAKESRPGCTQDSGPWPGDRRGPCGEEEESVPVRDVSGVDSAGSSTHSHSHTHLPDTHLPDTHAHLPHTHLPHTHTHTPPRHTHTHLPDTHLPDTHLPDTHLPDAHTHLPDTHTYLPDTHLPDTHLPDTHAHLPDTHTHLPDSHMVDSRDVQAEIALQLQPERSQNALLRRRVRILNQQLQERERAERESRQNQCDSEACTLQAELRKGAELRQALRDTQSRLRDAAAENVRIQTELDITSSRLLKVQRRNAELELLTQQRHTVHHLHRTPDPPSVTTTDAARPHPLTKRALDQYERSQAPAAQPHLHAVSQYLSSLGGGGGEGGVCGESTFGPWDEVSTTHEDKENKMEAPLIAAATTTEARPPPQSLDSVLRLLHLDSSSSSLSLCEVISVASNWSACSSGSTFDTRDEVQFQNGLAALDASIASLQRTIQTDLQGK